MKTKIFLFSLIAASMEIASLFSGVAYASYDPRAGFSGVWTEHRQGAPERTQIVAYYKNYETPSHIKHRAEIRIFSVLGTAHPMPMIIEYEWAKMVMDGGLYEYWGYPEGKIKLTFPELWGEETLHLRVTHVGRHSMRAEGTVALPNQEIKRVRLEYGSAIHLTILNPDGSENLSIQLDKGIKLTEPLEPVLSLNQILGRAKFLTFQLGLAAEAIYQGRKETNVANAALGPNLNGRTLAGVTLALFLTGLDALNGFLIFDIVDNLAPFIYPVNHLNRGNAYHGFKAQITSFRTIQRDQMRIAQGLFYTIQRDERTIAFLEKRERELNQAIDGAQNFEILGGFSDSTTFLLELQVSLGEVQKGLTALRSKVRTQKAQLSSALAFNPIDNQEIALTEYDSIPFENVSDFPRFDVKNTEALAVTNSIELKAHRDLRIAAKRNTWANDWACLRPGAGVQFDFSWGPKIEIAKSEERVLKLEGAKITSKLQADSVAVTNTLNSSLDEFKHLKSIWNWVYDQREASLLRRNLQEMEKFNDELNGLNIRLNVLHADIMIAHAEYQALTMTGVYRPLNAKFLEPAENVVQAEVEGLLHRHLTLAATPEEAPEIGAADFEPGNDSDSDRED